MLSLFFGITFGLVFSAITSLIVYKKARLDVSRLKSKLEEEQENFKFLMDETEEEELIKTKAGKELLTFLDREETTDFTVSKIPNESSSKIRPLLFYRPTEDHVGVVYRFNKFNRFADPERWMIILPFIESVPFEISLQMRTTAISLENIFTSDKIALNADLKIFYSVDLRKVTTERRSQVLRFSEPAWDNIIHTAINDIARNSVFVSKSLEELTNQQGRAALKQSMSRILSERVSGFGILLNPRFSVNIVNLQLNDEFRKTLMDESTAKALGATAASRLAPLLKNFSDQKQEKAIAALITQIASAIARTGKIPEVNFPSDEQEQDLQPKPGLLGKKDNPPLTTT